MALQQVRGGSRGRAPEARPLAASAYDTCLAAFGPDAIRTDEARTLLARIDHT
ncbi:hypothetical protein [Streptomyces sp. NPDC101115]|uniref:hypothetical protein n=1 Tax=Streptomyces sp. NPDC101115 TaxID=3366106 RepID=UPI00380B63C8